MVVELLDIHVSEVSLGIYPKERREPQAVVVHLRLGLDVQAVAQVDAVEHTADYASLVADTQDLCTRGHFELLETLVMALARHLLQRHKTLVHADVTIDKVHAPVQARVSARWRLSRLALEAFRHAAGASGVQTNVPPHCG